MGIVRKLRTGSGTCTVAWGWTDANPTQFAYVATTSGEADVSGGIARALRKVTISGLVPGKSWNITITSIGPGSTLGSVLSGAIPPINALIADPAFTSGSPTSTMVTLHLAGNAGLGGSWQIVTPIGELTPEGSEINISIGPFPPDFTIAYGDIQVRAVNSGGNSDGWVSWPETSTGAASAVPDLNEQNLDDSPLDPFAGDPEDERDRIDFSSCTVYWHWRWFIINDMEVDTWDIYLNGVQLVTAGGRFENKDGLYLDDYKWRLSFSKISSGDPNIFLDVGDFSVTNFRVLTTFGPSFTLRVDATNAHGTTEGPEVSGHPTCDGAHPYMIKVLRGPDADLPEGRPPVSGNPNNDMLLVDETELGVSGEAGRRHPHGVYVGSNLTTTYEFGKIFTVPRTDAAVKADAGYSDIRQAGFGGSQADVHMILQEKSVSKLHPIRPGARRHVLANDVIDKFLKTPDVTLSLGTDGSLTLSDTDRGSLNISDGYDLGAITLQDDDNGSILLTETEQVPVSYIGEKL